MFTWFTELDGALGVGGERGTGGSDNVMQHCMGVAGGNLLDRVERCGSRLIRMVEVRVVESGDYGRVGLLLLLRVVLNFVTGLTDVVLLSFSA